MKRTCVLIGIIVAVLINVSLAGPRDDLWKQVDDAISKGLPQTAIDLLEQIIPGALQDEAYAEATRAVCLKIVQEGHIQGNQAEELIVRLEAEIATAPEAMKPVMEGVLGHWYWTYFQQNRWRFMQRTTTAESPGEDILTWDLARILAEIDKHFTLALAAEETLKATPIADWDDLLEKGTVPDTYRPTLYDFLTHDALTFYSSGEQAALPEDTFEIMADSPIFAPVDEFLAWEPQTSDTQSAKLKAIRLYQSLLAFHQNDRDETAFLDADLYRLLFGYNQALGPEKDDLYEQAMERFADEWKDHELSARALYEWARVVYSQGDYVRARALASRGWDAYPASIGGIQCYNLIQEIEAKSASITTERVWNDPLPDIVVTYRNVTQVFFRAVPVDWESLVRPNTSYVTGQSLEELLAAQPVREWHANLPATDDYQQRTERLPAAQGLASGTYCILASHDPSFKRSDNQISTACVWVSDLALVVRTVGQTGAVEGFVLEANNGEPVTGATVTRWVYGKYDSTTRTACSTSRPSKTDMSSFCSSPSTATRDSPARTRTTRTRATAWSTRPTGPSSSPTARSTAPGRPSTTRASASTRTQSATPTRRWQAGR
jgi:hypothetical protein